MPSLRWLIKGWEIWLQSHSSDAQAFEVNCSTVTFCFIVPPFLSWVCDISAFNAFTLQNPKLFMSRVTPDSPPCLAQCGANVTVQLVDESTLWGRGAWEYVLRNEEGDISQICLCISTGGTLCPC